MIVSEGKTVFTGKEANPIIGKQNNISSIFFIFNTMNY